MQVDGAGWGWVEVDGVGWNWVHGLVIPFLICHLCNFKVDLILITHMKYVFI